MCSTPGGTKKSGVKFEEEVKVTSVQSTKVGGAKQSFGFGTKRNTMFVNDLGVSNLDKPPTTPRTRSPKKDKK